MDYELIILSCLLLLCFWIKILYGIYFLIFWISVTAFGFFFSCNGIHITTQDFPQSDIFYECFQGDYSTLYAKLSVFHSIRKKFHLPSCYKPFGIFYDNPKTSKKKSHRAIIGILCDNEEKNKSFKDYQDSDYIGYMKDKDYKKSSIDQAKCLYGDYEAYVSIKNSFVFIAKVYIQIANQKFFIRLYNPKWKESVVKVAKINYKKHYGVLEVFDEKVVKFYIAVEDEGNFLFKCD